MPAPQIQERYIDLFGMKVKVTAYKKSKTVWEAHGDYKGQHYQTKGSSANVAFTAWEQRVKSMEF